mmetsp:Transcript_14265/g.29976  ORF Transcript_14265/g.29976 Transcript_14265/m.29976 type:complete len:184 (+) Transcript_14265:126-677(+)
MCLPKNITDSPHCFVQMNIEVTDLRHEPQHNTVDRAANTTTHPMTSFEESTETFDSFWDYEDAIIDISDASRSSNCDDSMDDEDRSNVKTSCHSSCEGDLFSYLSDPENNFMKYLLGDEDEENEYENEIESEECGGLDVSFSENSVASKSTSASAARRKRVTTEAHPDMILLHLLEAEGFGED